MTKGLGKRSGNAIEGALINRHRVKTVVLASGIAGLRISAVRAATKLSLTTVGDHLRALLESGEIERSSDMGAHVRWGAPGIRAANQAGRERAARRKAAKLRNEQQADSQWVAPMRVASVWELARVEA